MPRNKIMEAFKKYDLADQDRIFSLMICAINLLFLTFTLVAIGFILAKNSEKGENRNIYALAYLNYSQYRDQRNSRTIFVIVSEEFAASFDKQLLSECSCWIFELDYIYPQPNLARLKALFNIKSPILSQRQRKEIVLKRIQQASDNYNYKQRKIVLELVGFAYIALFIAQTIRLVYQRPLLVIKNKQHFHFFKHLAEAIIDCIVIDSLYQLTTFQETCILRAPSQFTDKLFLVLTKILRAALLFFQLKKSLKLKYSHWFYVPDYFYTANYTFGFYLPCVLISFKSLLAPGHVFTSQSSLILQEKYLKEQILRNRYLSTFFLIQLEPTLDEDLLSQVAELLNTYANQNSEELISQIAELLNSYVDKSSDYQWLDQLINHD